MLKTGMLERMDSLRDGGEMEKQMDLRRQADEIFDAYNCYPGEGERNHCLRLVEFALLHAQHMGKEVDQDLIYLAAMLHDLGLMVTSRPGTSYLTRTVEIAQKELDGTGLDEDSWRILEDCLLYNHSVKSLRSHDPASESFRRAVFTEHTRGVWKFGLRREEVRRVFRQVPYDNFAAVLADFVWKTSLFEPKTIPQIFIPNI